MEKEARQADGQDLEVSVENGSFQTPYSEISNLEFQNEGLPPTPNRTPALADTRTKSSTVEALLSQNEDLMARLKVTLRRLTALEDENDQLRENNRHVLTDNSSLSDQLLVWREKENFWQKKNEKLENEMQGIRARFPELELMEEKLERYKKYHEKVKTQVKPYIQQLKTYAQNLINEIRKLNSEIEAKEIRVQEVEKRLRDLRLEVDDQLQRNDEQSRKLVEIFESEKDRLRLELTETRKINAQLEMKAEKLDEALTRQDELENVIIALRRSKEEHERGAIEILNERDEEIQKIRTQSVEDRCRIEDLETKLKAASGEANRHRNRAEQLEEQLTSLRFLWTNKSDEIEKLQTTIRSLEKLNQELSHRLNQSRKGEASL